MRLHWLVLPLAAACASEAGTDAHWTFGKGDGVYDLVEAGPAPVGDRVTVELGHRVPAYRVQSFGGTALAIDLQGDDPYLVIEGPLDNNGDSVAVGAGHVVAEGRAHLEVTLDKGVYRILAGTYASLGQGRAATGSVTLAVTCSANCWRAMIDQKTFVRALQAQGAFDAYAKAELAKVVPDPTMQQQLADQLDAILADSNLSGLERFPLIPLSSVSTVRPALGANSVEHAGARSGDPW